MTAYQQFKEEKLKIDDFIERRYKIAEVKEDLNGASVVMEHPGGERTAIQILTADARKYLVNAIIKQINAS
ncbi:hypothetical protein [Paenibacillus harenae]|uniref:Uncharacterized protein n=1 Tax=Paenibacillus harenae TaxID=306543 RepID=A0ABT9U8B4_PAEHA|nr:hypothetical protein [Paenibacillus harenae]MDQ0058901.1 hypothetical protein [Paenibacillus harenae]MDQ0114444.1 hypothetical protein [Paenibacillus harenae]